MPINKRIINSGAAIPLEIQSAGYTDTSTLSEAGGTRYFRVTGVPGSTYDLSGYGAGSYTLSSSPYDHAIGIGSNGTAPCYSGSSRTISTTLTPTGDTTITGGASSITSSFTQSGGTGIINWSMPGGDFSIYISSTNVCTAGRFAAGNTISATYSISGSYSNRVMYYVVDLYLSGSTVNNASVTVSKYGGSGTLSSTPSSNVNWLIASITAGDDNCYTTNGIGTGIVYCS